MNNNNYKEFLVNQNILLFFKYTFVDKKLINHIIELYHIPESYILKLSYNNFH